MYEISTKRKNVVMLTQNINSQNKTIPADIGVWH